MCDSYFYLVVKTVKRGKCEIIYRSDSEDDASDVYLAHVKQFREEIEKGLYRFDMYKWCA